MQACTALYEELGRAQSLILGILEQGITIVTLSLEREYTPGSANNLGAAIEIIVTLYRAHEESAMKSQRVGAAWANKRKNIGTRKLTARCPSWLALSDDKTGLRVLPEAARTVGRIFKMVTDGYGVDTIARRFNAEGVWTSASPTITAASARATPQRTSPASAASP